MFTHGLDEASFQVPEPLEADSVYYWRILGTGDYTPRTFAAYIVAHIGDCHPNCCDIRVGDANGEGGDEPTIGDVSVMIDALFITGDCVGPDPENPILPCLPEADVNQSGGCYPTCAHVTIGDIAVLIDRLFIRGPSIVILPNCL